MNKTNFFTTTFLVAASSHLLSSCSTIKMVPAPASRVDVSNWPAKPIHYKATIVQEFSDSKSGSHRTKILRIVDPTPVIHEGEKLWKVDVEYQAKYYTLWVPFVTTENESFFFEGDTCRSKKKREWGEVPPPHDTFRDVQAPAGRRKKLMENDN